MELHEALTQIEAIHARMARGDVFRGFRAATVGWTGIMGLAAAALQPYWVPDPRSDIDAYLRLWVAVAGISLVVVALELSVRWYRDDSPFSRRQTVHAARQFFPCVLAGAVVTWILPEFATSSAHLLPGLWAVFFSLGVFASLQHLPAAALWIGTYYLLAGTICLVCARGENAFSPWAMAITFGGGQLLTAVFLFWTLERKHAE